MKNILLYGNCQLRKITDLLKINKNYTITYIECFSTCITEIEFNNLLLSSDIIITQPINDNYRDMHYLSSNYIVNNCNNTSSIIFVNNCHFDFYYFDLKYNKNQNIINYHHNSIIECINNNKDSTYYENVYVNNEKLRTYSELNKILDNNFIELEKRYTEMLQYSRHNTYFISIIDFIKNNYKNKLLFYSFNHPSKYLLQYISERIKNILHFNWEVYKNNYEDLKHFTTKKQAWQHWTHHGEKEKRNYKSINLNNEEETNIIEGIDYHSDPFSNDRYILYKCIQKMVYFDIDNHKALVNNKSSIKEIYEMTIDSLQL
jgi:hypothetical protein